MPENARKACVVVLHDDVEAGAAEDDLDTLVQLEAVRAALEASAGRVEALAFSDNLPLMRKRLSLLKPDCVFNLVESRAGHGALIHLAPALLESMQLPYTGAPLHGLFLSSHKLLAKRWMAQHGIATPANEGQSSGPWIIKSVWEDASFGIDAESVVYEPEALTAERLKRRQRYGGEWFAEDYIYGREFNLSMLETESGCQVLPPAEICFDDFPQNMPRIVGYHAKWKEDSFEYQHTQRRFHTHEADAQLYDELHRMALQCWKIFSLRGYARVDFRVDAENKPWALEVNANPCLSPDAGFPAALREAGIRFDQAIADIINAALRPLMTTG
ncbi:MAG: hypothetical protein MRJ65_15620 [Candidatus Brocadiaceae bacterium]|nr:hypothetical protein [Candidatus Brocadiaceae bacterium]